MRKIILLMAVVIVFLISGCSTVSSHFTDKAPRVVKISSSKYRIEFAVKDENQGGSILEKAAKSACRSGRYEVDNYDTEFVPMFYTIIKATIVCK